MKFLIEEIFQLILSLTIVVLCFSKEVQNKSLKKTNEEFAQLVLVNIGANSATYKVNYADETMIHYLYQCNYTLTENKSKTIKFFKNVDCFSFTVLSLDLRTNYNVNFYYKFNSTKLINTTSSFQTTKANLILKVNQTTCNSVSTQLHNIPKVTALPNCTYKLLQNGKEIKFSCNSFICEMSCSSIYITTLIPMINYELVFQFQYEQLVSVATTTFKLQNTNNSTCVTLLSPISTTPSSAQFIVNLYAPSVEVPTDTCSYTLVNQDQGTETSQNNLNCKAFTIYSLTPDTFYSLEFTYKTEIHVIASSKIVFYTNVSLQIINIPFCTSAEVFVNNLPPGFQLGICLFKLFTGNVNVAIKCASPNCENSCGPIKIIDLMEETNYTAVFTVAYHNKIYKRISSFSTKPKNKINLYLLDASFYGANITTKLQKPFNFNKCLYTMKNLKTSATFTPQCGTYACTNCSIIEITNLKMNTSYKIDMQVLVPLLCGNTSLEFQTKKLNYSVNVEASHDTAEVNIISDKPGNTNCNGFLTDKLTSKIIFNCSSSVMCSSCKSFNITHLLPNTEYLLNMNMPNAGKSFKLYVKTLPLSVALDALSQPNKINLLTIVAQNYTILPPYCSVTVMLKRSKVFWCEGNACTSCSNLSVNNLLPNQIYDFAFASAFIISTVNSNFSTDNLEIKIQQLPQTVINKISISVSLKSLSKQNFECKVNVGGLNKCEHCPTDCSDFKIDLTSANNFTTNVTSISSASGGYAYITPLILVEQIVKNLAFPQYVNLVLKPNLPGGGFCNVTIHKISGESLPLQCVKNCPENCDQLNFTIVGLNKSSLYNVKITNAYMNTPQVILVSTNQIEYSLQVASVDFSVAIIRINKNFTSSLLNETCFLTVLNILTSKKTAFINTCEEIAISTAQKSSAFEITLNASLTSLPTKPLYFYSLPLPAINVNITQLNNTIVFVSFKNPNSVVVPTNVHFKLVLSNILGASKKRILDQKFISVDEMRLNGIVSTLLNVLPNKNYLVIICINVDADYCSQDIKFCQTCTSHQLNTISFILVKPSTPHLKNVFVGTKSELEFIPGPFQTSNSGALYCGIYIGKILKTNMQSANNLDFNSTHIYGEENVWTLIFQADIDTCQYMKSLNLQNNQRLLHKNFFVTNLYYATSQQYCNTKRCVVSNVSSLTYFREKPKLSLLFTLFIVVSVISALLFFLSLIIVILKLKIQKGIDLYNVSTTQDLTLSKVCTRDNLENLSTSIYSQNQNFIPLSEIEIEKYSEYYAEVVEKSTSSMSSQFQKFNEIKLTGFFNSQLPQNAMKNRYRNIVPDDQNRVILEVNELFSEDYINATFFDGENRKNEYIASQGPLDETLVDFYRMLISYKIKTVVMLTKFMEGFTIKCAQYLPEKSLKLMLNNNISVDVLECEMQSETEMRLIKVTSPFGSTTFKHFYYTEWGDHSVPSSCKSFIKLRNMVRQWHSNSNTPIVVHCSAGVGRTGAFLTIDYNMCRLETLKKTFKVFDYIKYMRMHRPLMVQTYDQYIFVHKILYLFNLMHDTKIDLATFKQECFNLEKNESRLKKIFEEKYQSKLSNNSLEQHDRTGGFIQFTQNGLALSNLKACYVDTEFSKRLYIYMKSPLHTNIGLFYNAIHDMNIPAIIYVGSEAEHNFSTDDTILSQNVMVKANTDYKNYLGSQMELRVTVSKLAINCVQFNINNVGNFYESLDELSSFMIKIWNKIKFYRNYNNCSIVVHSNDRIKAAILIGALMILEVMESKSEAIKFDIISNNLKEIVPNLFPNYENFKQMVLLGNALITKSYDQSDKN